MNFTFVVLAVIASRATGGVVEVVAIAVEVVAFIGSARAVLIDSVLADLLGRGIHAGIRVVAVRGVEHRSRRLVTLAASPARGGIPVAVAIRVGVIVLRVRRPDVRRAVAVVVDPVANLDFAGTHTGIAVVTIAVHGGAVGRLLAGYRGHGRITPAVAVLIQIPGRGVGGVVLVGRPVAVVVDPVADFRLPGIDVLLRVIAVSRVRYVVLGRLAAHRGGGHIAVPIDIRVRVPDARIDRIVLVGVAVAVVVDLIAGFRRYGAHTGVTVVAVLAGRVAVAISVSRSTAPIAVVIVGISAVILDRARVVRRVRVIAVATQLDVTGGDVAVLDCRCVVAIPVAVEIRITRDEIEFLVGVAVAVVIDAVAGFRRGGTHAGVRIITVLRVVVPIAVAVCTGSAVVRRAGAVVVQAVAELE